MSTEEEPYATVRIPLELAKEVEGLIGKKGFRSKAEVVKEALRQLLSHYSQVEMTLPRFEHINSDSNGTKILDRQLRRVVDISINSQGIRCAVDGTEDCEHVAFALSHPQVQRIIRKKKKEGWKLPDV